MTPEQFEQIMATIDKGLTNRSDKRSISENSTVTIGLLVLLITFICGSFIYIDNVKKEMFDEMEKRFVQSQDYTAVTTTISSMKEIQSEMKADIKEIKATLENVKIKSK